MSVDSEPLGEDEMFTFDEEAGTQDMMKHEDLDEAPHVRTLPPLHTPCLSPRSLHVFEVGGFEGALRQPGVYPSLAGC